MNNFDIEFQHDFLSISPHLMFEQATTPVIIDSPLSETIYLDEEPIILTPVDRKSIIKYVFSDHSYAKPFPVLYETKHDKLAVPAKLLQVHPKQRTSSKKRYMVIDSQKNTVEEEIDIESVEKQPESLVRYDVNKANSVMNEVETYLNSLWKDVEKDDEEKFTRGNWSRDQAKFFDVAYKIINNYQLAKLTYVENANEPVLRKLALDKATKRFRKLYGGSFWNSKLIVWLHGIMIDGMGSSLFLCYLEIIQSLKRLVPSLIERTLLFDRVANEKEQTAGLPNLGSKLKKSWEPSVGLNTRLNIEKFPTTPFLIIVPSGPSIPHQSTKRNRFWNNQLLTFSKPFPINVPAYRTPDGYVIKHYLEHCISATRAKIKEFSNRFPGRHIVLVGWGTGSIVSFKVALLEKVDAIICLGFPFNGLGNESTEDYWDGLIGIECPALFLIGQNALTNSKEKTEKFRSKLKYQSNLVIVEHGDEMLRLPKSQKRILGMTQSMIDKLIQDEIYLFLKDVLFRQKNPRTQNNLSPKKRKKKIEITDESKKKKKNFSKIPPIFHAQSSLSPLGLHVQVPSVQAGSPAQGLLTTATSVGMISSLNNNGRGFNMHIQPTNYNIKTNAEFKKQAAGQKRSMSKEKDFSKKMKVAKKQHPNKCLGSNFLPCQRFTASLGNQKSGNLTAQRFSTYAANQMNKQQTNKRALSSGSFVLSSGTGHVRFQGGTNFLYLQPSSGSTPAVHGTPFLTTSSGAFTAVIPSTAINCSSMTSPYYSQPLTQSALNSPSFDPILMEEAKQAAAMLGGNFDSDSSPETPVNTSPIIDLPISIFNQVTNARQINNLIAKYSNSNPNSPTTPSKYFSIPLSSVNSNETTSVIGNTMDAMQQTLDKRISILTTSDGVKKVSYSPSLIQKKNFSSSRDPSPKLKVPRLKTNKNNSGIVTINKPPTHKSAVNPFALNIPIASLTGSQQHGGLSKSISGPTLSKYLSQHRIILSSTRSSPTFNNRSITLTAKNKLSPITSNILNSPSLFLNHNLVQKSQEKSTNKVNPGKSNIVYQLSKTSIQQGSTHPTQGSASFELNHAPNLANNIDIQKAAHDVKLIDLLNTRTLTSQIESPQVSKYSPNNTFDDGADDLIQPRNHNEKTTLFNPLADHMFSSLKIPVELERSGESVNINKDIDFGIMDKQVKRQSYLNNVSVSKNDNVAPISATVFGQVKVTLASSTIHNDILHSPPTKTIPKPAFLSLSTDNKLRFQPLRSPTTSSQLSAVLANMRETGKIVIDENGKLRTTLITRPKSVVITTAPQVYSSRHEHTKTISSNKNELLTSASNQVMISCQVASDTEVMSKLTTLPVNNKIIHNSTQTVFHNMQVPDAKLITKLEVKNKAVALPTKSNSTIADSSVVKVYPIRNPSNATVAIQKIVVASKASRKINEDFFEQSPSKTVEPKIKSPKSTPKKSKIIHVIEDTTEEPPEPYITRSGRVLRSRYSTVDDIDKDFSPTKQRRSLSANNIDDVRNNAFDSLLEAARIIKSEVAIKLDNNGHKSQLVDKNVGKLSSGNDLTLELENLPEIPDKVNNKSTLPIDVNGKPSLKAKVNSENIESTASMAASAMLELLTSNSSRSDI